MNDLHQRKREILARSEAYRRAIVAECSHIQAATAWVPRTLQYARLIPTVLAVAAPLAGWLFGSRKKAPVSKPARKRSLLATVLTGYKVARQVKPIWEGFRRSRAHY